ncbi:hypothetical protein REPUB_Repub07fG0229200 [Reevesia pubescens]
MEEPISLYRSAIRIAIEEFFFFIRSEGKYVKSASTSTGEVDLIREINKFLTEFETNNNCFGEARSKDSACDAKHLAADQPVHILKKRFQKEEEASISMKYKILRDLRIQEHKRIIAKLEAENKKLRKEKAKVKEMEVKLEAEHRRFREEEAKLKEMKALLDRISSSKFETDVEPIEYFIEQLDPIANVKSEVDISTFKPLLESFLGQLDANVKSQVDYSDFKILEEDTGKDFRMVGRFNVPLPLAPISERINDTFGDITSESSQSDCAATPSYVLLCAAIKDMDDFKLEQVTKAKILLWRDAINSAFNVQFKVGFAKKHLKRIARAYFGFKAMEEKSNEKLKNIDGTVRKIEVPEDCIREAIYFRGKPLSTGLFH